MHWLHVALRYHLRLRWSGHGRMNALDTDHPSSDDHRVFRYLFCFADFFRMQGKFYLIQP